MTDNQLIFRGITKKKETQGFSTKLQNKITSNFKPCSKKTLLALSGWNHSAIQTVTDSKESFLLQ